MASCVSCGAEPRGCGWLVWISGVVWWLPGGVVLVVVVGGVVWWLSTQEKGLLVDQVIAKIEAETNWVERVGGCLTCGTLDGTHFFDQFARVCADCVLAAVIEDQIIGGNCD